MIHKQNRHSSWKLPKDFYSFTQKIKFAWPIDASSIFRSYSFFKEKGLLGSDPGISSDFHRSGKSRNPIRPGLLLGVILKIKLEKIQETYLLVRLVHMDETHNTLTSKQCNWGSLVSYGSVLCSCTLWRLNNTSVRVVALIPGILTVSLSSIHPLLY